MTEELKTLKDLEGDIGSAEYFHREDIEPTKDYGKVILVDELKAEAVKWVNMMNSDLKFLKSKIEENKDHYNFYINSELINKGVKKRNQIEWIKHFFNLTEEDLE